MILISDNTYETLPYNTYQFNCEKTAKRTKKCDEVNVDYTIGFETFGRKDFYKKSAAGPKPNVTTEGSGTNTNKLEQTWNNKRNINRKTIVSSGSPTEGGLSLGLLNLMNHYGA